MPNYCVNRNAQSSSRDNEVHDLASTHGCLPIAANRVGLGSFVSCSGAVAEAKRLGYNNANGCAWCAPACHTT